jgi:hypothetical protein
MKTLRLLLFAACNRSCEGCCNKQWDLTALPVCESYVPFEEIILTGGEPMLAPVLVHQTIDEIRRETPASIYLYTAKVDDWLAARGVLNHVDGMTVTLHEQRDLEPWTRFNENIREYRGLKRLRLNVFSDVRLAGVTPEDLDGWELKTGIEWIENCPLPENEVFMRRRPR